MITGYLLMFRENSPLTEVCDYTYLPTSIVHAWGIHLLTSGIAVFCILTVAVVQREIKCL